MILTCPACATRYFVEDARIGPTGRTVRCASCGSAWRAQLEEPLELTASAEEGAIAREPLSFKSDGEPAEPTAPELPKAFRARQQQKRKMREAAVAGVVWGGLAASFAALLGAAYLFRVDVVKLYPSTAGAYAAVGVPVNPTGLEFEKIKADPAADGLPAVVVSGLVRNVETEVAAVPPVLVALLDKGGKRLSTRVVKLSSASIAPGKALSFSVALADPDATTATVEATFLLEKPKPKPKPAKAAKPKGGAQAQAEVKKPEPAKLAAKPVQVADSGLRPARSVAMPAPVEARPLPAGDPYALDSGAHGALSAPHG